LTENLINFTGCFQKRHAVKVFLINLGLNSSSYEWPNILLLRK